MGEPIPPSAAGEESVAIESEHLAAIVRSSDDAILSKDRNAIVTSWNEGAERLYGYSRKEAVGQSVGILIPPDRRGEELEIVDRSWRASGSSTTRPSGYARTAPPPRIADGISDPRRRGRDRRRLHAGPRHLEDEPCSAPRGAALPSAFEDAPVGMAVFSAEADSFGMVQQANAEMTRLLGYTEDELKALTPGDLTHPADVTIEQRYHPRARGRRPQLVRDREAQPAQGRHWVCSVTVSLLDGGDPPLLALAHVLDVTERKQSEEELRLARQNLERSNDELDQFAYVASHDLKEPLILLSAYARMLDERQSDSLERGGPHLPGPHPQRGGPDEGDDRRPARLLAARDARRGCRAGRPRREPGDGAADARAEARGGGRAGRGDGPVPARARKPDPVRAAVPQPDLATRSSSGARSHR